MRRGGQVSSSRLINTNTHHRVLSSPRSVCLRSRLDFPKPPFFLSSPLVLELRSPALAAWKGSWVAALFSTASRRTTCGRRRDRPMASPRSTPPPTPLHAAATEVTTRQNTQTKEKRQAPRSPRRCALSPAISLSLCLRRCVYVHTPHRCERQDNHNRRDWIPESNPLLHHQICSSVVDNGHVRLWLAPAVRSGTVP